MRYDTVTIGLLGLLVGMVIQPYVQLGLEWWLSRPRRMDPFNIHDHCKDCDIR